MRMRHIPWAIALVCVVLGFMLSMQFKVQQQVHLKDVTALMRSQELAGQLEQAESERDKLMTEVDTMRTEMTQMANTQAGYEALAKQLESAQLSAGLVPMQGTGVTIEMRDSTRNLGPNDNPNNFLIHDGDVLGVVNDLRATGAEAISINEQRLIGRTEIRCGGPTIIVNGVRTAPPIVIKAIGNPDDLEGIINMKDGTADQLRAWGISVTVKKEQAVVVPAYKGSLQLKYGSPAK